MSVSSGSFGSTMVTFAYYLCFAVIFNGHNAFFFSDAANTKAYTEKDIQFWIENGKGTLAEKLEYVNKKGVAKNIIMFLGDGMSLTTLTASRIYKGQMKKRTGENEYLSFEKFPFVGMSKTYCVDKQVADSACTATAYLTGVKANFETIGVTAKVKTFDCLGSLAPENRTQSIAEWSMKHGKAVGLVTTARVTHASPAGLYAHVASREWEDDGMSGKENEPDVSKCDDIAKQLVTGHPGKDIKVILGGGRQMFLHKNNTERKGNRMDMDLLKLWKEDKTKRFRTHNNATYVEDREQLLNVDPSKTDYLLGLFDDKHMKFHLNADPKTQPTLEEMTEKAIEILKKEKNGFFLFVEGGLIDSAHHMLFAKKALDETVEFSKAVQRAVDMTSEDDTLIVVTSDHSHVMTMSGYPDRGQGITGMSGMQGLDGLPYPTLSYANGPSAKRVEGATAGCNGSDSCKVNIDDPSYRYPSLVPLDDETHGGDDVMVFARGPWAHLFSGNYEQNIIPLTMGYAAGIGPLAGLKNGPAPYSSAGYPVASVPSLFYTMLGSFFSTYIVVVIRSSIC
ncbi:Alkaline-phosphatase-like, core domain,Alkaline phosphatase-like, alpha/beta/alpha,Alkaline [Cinara cedri]|uniref:Alkaline phosphatase n=1 Tax=Cinara cedri TaxID=506608 RepID=A0A5E4ME36_9HEMI|nr:Alkaline-phosphatase-like, core domain,Alkaline phosphatase-like, alpha/beta/alpha,Alkaline [Cinara cedri]